MKPTGSAAWWLAFHFDHVLALMYRPVARTSSLSYGALIGTNLRGGCKKSKESCSGELARLSLAANLARPKRSSMNFRCCRARSGRAKRSRLLRTAK